jgi:hypothetical protein
MHRTWEDTTMIPYFYVNKQSFLKGKGEFISSPRFVVKCDSMEDPDQPVAILGKHV